MKPFVLILLAAASAVAIAQAPAKPATTAKPATAAKSATAVSGVKLPPGVPPAHGIIRSAFSLRYQDTKIGSGALAEPNKMYIVHYTGWLAADGRKFDSSYDHPQQPVLDKDGKAVLDADGKPKTELLPFSFPQGNPRLISGWNLAFDGMKVGGKRRVFIPWQMAYGALGHPTGDPKNPGIPPKADLIFDIELVDVTDIPMPANHPGMGGMPGMRPMPGMAPKPGAQGAPAAPAAAPKAPAAGAPAVPAAPATPAQPQSK